MRELVDIECEEAEFYMRFGSRAERRGDHESLWILIGRPNHLPFPDGLTIVGSATVLKVVRGPAGL